MIQANELRCGNLLMYSDNSTIFTVSGIHEYGIDCFDEFEETYMEYENFNGIHLTEELLLRLGYEEIRENNFYILGHQIWRIENRFYCDKNGVELECVHDLQNLYYSLTKTELTLNREKE